MNGVRRRRENRDIQESHLSNAGTGWRGFPGGGNKVGLGLCGRLRQRYRLGLWRRLWLL